MKKPLVEDMDNMVTIMCRLATRDDIWQDRFVYWMAKGIYDICDRLIKIMKKMEMEENQ